ncbi:hypothetical protein BOTNAR_0047g00370 [Botryotinia narcissicola]|uniref:Uncharacterized protein n=1 Tax=Botryotinia narcissicola TaxID=278944 RepID=A0A4Z1J0I6_9HELO|nr:hypothetical protein BOTNAR_0047g00370 [Botryotinia narcissicola]
MVSQKWSAAMTRLSLDCGCNSTLKALVPRAMAKHFSIAFESDEVVAHALKSEIKTTAPTCAADFKGYFTVGNDSVMPKTIMAAVAAETSAASRGSGFDLTASQGNRFRDLDGTKVFNM